MLGMISAVIGVLVLFATQLAFPELNERFKSFSSIRYLLLAGAFAVSTFNGIFFYACLLYTSPSPRDRQKSRMPSSA